MVKSSREHHASVAVSLERIGGRRLSAESLHVISCGLKINSIRNGVPTFDYALDGRWVCEDFQYVFWRSSLFHQEEFECREAL